MPIERLDKLQYSVDRKGPWQLYIYLPNSDYHQGGIWFEAKPKYPEEEISTPEAMKRTFKAMAEGREVRIVDGGDQLVFHAQHGKVLYPAAPADFWAEITQ
jgi:hypothetical protein